MLTHDCCGCRAQAEVDSLAHVDGSSHPASDDHPVSCHVCITRCQVEKDQHAAQHFMLKEKAACPVFLIPPPTNDMRHSTLQTQAWEVCVTAMPLWYHYLGHAHRRLCLTSSLTAPGWSAEGSAHSQRDGSGEGDGAAAAGSTCTSFPSSHQARGHRPRH